MTENVEIKTETKRNINKRNINVKQLKSFASYFDGHKCHLYVLVKCIEDHEDGRDIVLQVLHH